MSHLAKHTVAVLLGAGLLLGGASLTDAHSPPLSWYQSSHGQTTSTANMCAYECALVNHDSSDWNCDDGHCSCSD